ncbi:MAG TPA: 2-dehydropantoate 2-reductase N-terminal domain-containing protein [Nitrosospira sp.]|nr:2-dehydropantoate 2-reductase N-terminal domain-containing protein [Nitrosospira sp.]
MKSSAHIAGAGGIGIAAAACLVRAGWDVTMIELNSAKITVGRLNEMWLDDQRIEGVRFIHFDEWVPPTDEVVLLCTKTFDNAPVLGVSEFLCARRSQTFPRRRSQPLI